MAATVATWAACLSLALVSAAATPVSVSFNETLVGFGTPGGAPDDPITAFEEAYDEGQQAGRSLGFSLTVTIDDVDAWLTDPNHQGVSAELPLIAVILVIMVLTPDSKTC
jgi:hypothetical protein